MYESHARPILYLEGISVRMRRLFFRHSIAYCSDVASKEERHMHARYVLFGPEHMSCVSLGFEQREDRSIHNFACVLRNIENCGHGIA